MKKYEQKRARSVTEATQSVHSLCVTLIYLKAHNYIDNDTENGQRRPGLDCTDVQADFGLPCAHSRKGTSLHGLA